MNQEEQKLFPQQDNNFKNYSSQQSAIRSNRQESDFEPQQLQNKQSQNQQYQLQMSSNYLNTNNDQPDNDSIKEPTFNPKDSKKMQQQNQPQSQFKVVINQEENPQFPHKNSNNSPIKSSRNNIISYNTNNSLNNNENEIQKQQAHLSKIIGNQNSPNQNLKQQIQQQQSAAQIENNDKNNFMSINNNNNANNVQNFLTPVHLNPNPQFHNSVMHHNNNLANTNQLNMNPLQLQQQMQQSVFNPQLGLSYINPFAFMKQMNMAGQNGIQQTQDHQPMEFSFVFFFLVIFKLMIIFSYVVLPMILVKNHHSYQTIVLYSLLDFWTIKNVSGRYMLGMRWWIEIDSAGEQRWVFECKLNTEENSEKLFWGIQGFATMSWMILSFISLIKGQIQMSMCFLIAFLQSSLNIWAYRQCNKAKEKKLKIYLNKLGADNNMLKSVKLTFDMERKKDK